MELLSYAILDHLTDAVCVLDHDKRVVFANRAMRALGGGVEKMELCHQCFCPCSQYCLSVDQCLVEEVIASGREVKASHFQTMGDGGPRYFEVAASPERDASGVIANIILVLHDVTEVTIAKQKLERVATIDAKREWTLTFDAIGDIVCLQDHDMRIIRVNQATEALFGKASGELIGQTCYALFHDGDKPCEGCPIDTVLATSQPHFGVVEHPKFNKVFEVTLSPIINEAGETTGYAHFAKDITGLKKLELQLREALKMEAVGRLAGGVAHDFNNVLTVISGYLGLAMAEVASDSPVKAALTEVEKAARRATGLVRQLLLFSRRQPMQFTAVDFNSALNELLKMLRRFIGENIRMEIKHGADLWPLAGDACSVDQVVMNLAVNARDAMPDGGILTIETSNVKVDEAFCRGSLKAKPGRFVRLSISDTGSGMDRETVQHIFEPFFTTKEAGKGTGLGLTVVYGIVKEHQGWISCFSEPGQGTVFHVYLPVADSALQAAQAPVGHDLRQIQGRGARVLIVEDEEAVLEFGGCALSHNGYHVAKAHTVAEAMEVASREGAEFDLLFTDVVLPDGYGTDLAVSVSALCPGIGIILTSGYPDKQGQWARISEQNWTFLQKPYEVPELLLVLQKELQPLAASS